MNFSEFYPDQISSVGSACKSDKPDILQRLIAAGKSIRANDSMGRQGIHWAAAQAAKHCLEILLKQDECEVDARSHDGSTPLLLACEAIADLKDTPFQDVILDVIRMLLAAGANPNLARDNQTTPLHLAARSWCKEAVEMLVEAKANTTKEDWSGDPPLFSALSADADDRRTEEDLVAVTKLIIEAGDDVPADQRNAEGRTVLQEAVKRRRFKAAESVLDTIYIDGKIMTRLLIAMNRKRLTVLDQLCAMEDFSVDLANKLIEHWGDVVTLSYERHDKMLLLSRAVVGKSESHERLFDIALARTHWRSEPVHFERMHDPVAKHPVALAIYVKKYSHAKRMLLRSKWDLEIAHMSSLPMSDGCFLCRGAGASHQPPAPQRPRCQLWRISMLALLFQNSSLASDEVTDLVEVMLRGRKWELNENDPRVVTALLMFAVDRERRVGDEEMRAAIGLFQKEGCRFRRHQYDHLLMHASVEMVVAMIQAFVLDPEDVAEYYSDEGLPSQFMSVKYDQSLANLLAVSYCFPAKRSALCELCNVSSTGRFHGHEKRLEVFKELELNSKSDVTLVELAAVEVRRGLKSSGAPISDFGRILETRGAPSIIRKRVLYKDLPTLSDMEAKFDGSVVYKVPK